MSYIDSNLLAGEQVVYRTRLHWLVFLAPVLLTVVVLLPIAWPLKQLAPAIATARAEAHLPRRRLGRATAYD